MAIQLPAPRDWQVFEDLCRELFAAIWGDPDTQKYGRSGQKQHGVDIFGRPSRGGAYAGVQCKYRRVEGEALTPKELDAEVHQAWERFDKELVSLTIATTAPPDTRAQDWAQAKTLEHRAEGLFSVHVLGWQELVDRLEAHDEVRQLWLHRLLGTPLPRQHPAYVEEVLRRHGEYQRDLFEKERLLGEPFALRDIYVELDAGVLRWGDVLDSRKGGDRGLDPFAEDAKSGGRHPLLPTVLAKIADPKFKDAIILQGPAGSGKSSFTKRLCAALLDEGLRPLRVELRQLDTTGALTVERALAQALQLDTEGSFARDDVFLEKQIFERGMRVGDAEICPYVLILDAWDEISTNATRGYLEEIQRLLERVRETFLERRKLPVRVLLAGRPTDAVFKSGFLTGESLLLTLRPQTPSQLALLYERIGGALTAHPLGEAAGWFAPSPERVGTLVQGYQPDERKLDVLGSPLLAFLALRLLAAWPGEPGALVAEPTSLYRCLVDLVVGKAGKPKEDHFQAGGRRALIAGSELRALLHGTAEAMTVLASESLRQDELARYLRQSAGELGKKVAALQQDHLLSRLLISFFFKADRPEHGCEFAHKSFREFLFAEAVVEELKAYGRSRKKAEPERPAENYWQDFARTDSRYALSRRLLNMLGPQWLTTEISLHLASLLSWEIKRVHGAETVQVGDPTEALAPERWQIVRDALADLWDWWGEGVHLRPQPPPLDGGTSFQPAAAMVVVEKVSARGGASDFLPPVRILTVDGHLGDALFELTAVVHAALARAAGFPGWPAAGPYHQPARRYQSRVARKFVLFAPSGHSEGYFRNYIARINAVGGLIRPEFPAARECIQVELIGADLIGANFVDANLTGANLTRSDLLGANLTRANLTGAKLVGANLVGAHVAHATLIDANFSRANLARAYLSGACLICTKLVDADLAGAYLTRSELHGANLTRADFTGAKLVGAQLPGAQLSGVNLISADLIGANLTRACLTGARLVDADLSDADLSGADLSGANLSGSLLTEANLSGALLTEANLSGANLSGVDRTTVDLSVARNVPPPKPVDEKQTSLRPHPKRPVM